MVDAVHALNVDLSEVTLGPLDNGETDFDRSLQAVLERIAPFTKAHPGAAPEDRIRRLGAAVNVTLDALDDLTGVVDTRRLPTLIDRIAELAVTGSNVEVQIGAAGDLRVDKRHRLVVDEIVTSYTRIPAPTRPAALRDGVGSLQRLLALLLLHGWTDGMAGDETVRQTARRAIVETVQGGA